MASPLTLINLHHHHYLYNCHQSPSLSIIITIILLSVSPSSPQSFYPYYITDSFSQYFEVTPGHNLTIAEGTSQTLPCIVRNLQGSCVWNHNNVAVWTGSPANGDCSLKINKVTLDKHDGLWQCQVTPPLEGVGEALVSKPITITVLVRPDRPHIERTPKYATVIPITANSSEVITCNVYNGNPLPKIEWFLNDRNITDQAVSRSTMPAVATGKKDILTMSELKYQFSQEHNNQTLSCRAHHPTGSFSDSVTVKVLYIPILAVPQPVYSVKEGSRINIDCKVDANPPATVYWKNQARGDPVMSDTPRILFFEEAKREMNGAVFECHAQNEKGVARPVPVRIDVLYPPHSVNYSTEQSVQTGKSIKLHCYFEGNPKPEIHWYQIDPKTGQHHRIDMHSDNNQVLYITNATYSHEGEYYCQATNVINDVTNVIRSPHMMLDIYGVPAFPHLEPMLVEGPRGQESRLTLDFCSDPPPSKVHWHYGSIQLDVKSIDYSNTDPSATSNHSMLRHRILPLNSIQSKRSSSTYFKCYEAHLEIRDTDISDERDYTLYVQNEYGVASRILRLKVVSPISMGLVVASALAVIFATILLSFLLMMLMKCRRKQKDNVDDEEAKEDAQVLSQAINTNNTDQIKAKPPSEKGNQENYELVYANLDFSNNTENARPIPPPTKPKPVIQQRTSLRGNGTPAGNLAGVMMANQQVVAAMAAQHQQVAQQPSNQHAHPQQLHQQPPQNHQHPASLHGTEYAKLSFPTKADL